MISPDELKRNDGWVAFDGTVYDITSIKGAPACAAKLLAEWGGRVCPDAALWRDALPKAMLRGAALAPLAPELTAEQVAEHGWVAFQGFVFDLDDFAERHPGGSELITDWKGKDGTAAILDAHPGGVAMIRATLSADEFAAAYKGSIPYTRKKRAVVKKKKARDAQLAKQRAFARLLGTVVFPALLAVAAAWHFEFRLAAWVPADWPRREHAAHLFLGGAAAIVLRGVLVRLGVLRDADRAAGGGRSAAAALSSSSSSSSAAGAGAGMGVGGWTYGPVTPELVARIRAACPAKGQVFAALDAEADGNQDDDDDDDQGDGGTEFEISTHSRDMSFHKRAAPDVVVYPATAEEVQAVVKAAFDAHVPVVPRGAGSGLEGGAIPYQGGVVLDLMRMKQFQLYPEEMQAQVGPGLKKSELNSLLEPHGFLFGPDPASNPSVGGMASTRGSGLSTLMYGTTAENVVTLRVVTPEGKLVRTRRRVRKSSTGYALTQLFVGSEGTLGVIVELTLQLRRVPRVRCGAFVGFASMHDAATATIALVQASLGTLCRCELLNGDGVAATNKKYGTSLEARPTIFLEYRSGGELDACEADARRGEEILKANGAKEYQFAARGEDLDKLWEARRGCYLAAMSYRDQKGDRVYLSDTCVPISNIARMVAETEADFQAAGFPCIICAHIADGNFHCCIPYQPSQQAKVKEIETAMIMRALALEGSVSGEHGVGIGKIAHILQEHGHDHLELQRAVKRAVDPRNIMNPGKVFILPRQPGGSCEPPAIYHETEGGATAGTYAH